jgi:hypothetical protein
VFCQKGEEFNIGSVSNSAIQQAYVKFSTHVFQKVHEIPSIRRFSGEWLQLLHSMFDKLPDFLILDLSNCLFVKAEEVKGCTFEMIFTVPVDMNVPYLPAPGERCLSIDADAGILKVVVLHF